MNGAKSQDIVLLLKLASLQEQDDEATPGQPQQSFQGESPYSVRGLESLLGISKTEVSASIKRCISLGLALKDRDSGYAKPNRRNLHDFIVHGLKFVFPAKLGAMTRGVPTAFAAPMLKHLLVSGGEYIFVWPSAEGQDIGQSVEPLFRTVPYAVREDDRLYEYLALVDAIRLGNQREARLAGERLSERLLKK